MDLPKRLRTKEENEYFEKFSAQRSRAKRQGIEWRLTFEQWRKIWKDSGKWHLRGIDKGCYVMCRKGDIGPYAVDNVRIDRTENNTIEAHKNKKDGPRHNYPISDWCRLERYRLLSSNDKL